MKFIKATIDRLAAATLFGLLLMGTIHSAQAITYTVDRTVGSGSVLGTISTDGTIGMITASNITDFNLTLNDGSNTVALLGGASGSAGISITSNAFTATATDLLFDFSANTNGWVLFQTILFNSREFYCLVDNASGCGSGAVGEHLSVLQHPTLHQYNVLSGSVSIASAPAVPIPPALPLFGTGIAVLGFMSWRKKRKAE